MAAQNHIPKSAVCNPKASVREDGYLSEDPSTWLRPDDTLMAGGHDWAWCYVWFKEPGNAPGYMVGSNGTVWSRRARFKAGLAVQWKQLAPVVQRSGHFRIGINVRGSRIMYRVHSLVLSVFYGPCPIGMECCHNNGIPSDNRLCNIRWDSRQANMRDRTEHGKTARGERSGCSKLEEADVCEILRMRREGLSTCAIAPKFNVHHSTIWMIVSGKRWQHVSGERFRGRRTRHMIEYRGTTKSVTEWARTFGMKPCTLISRLKRGFSIEAALTRPVEDRR